MNSELKQRIIDFIGDLDDSQLTEDQRRYAGVLYLELTRKPGRQPGHSPKKREATELLEKAGPDGKELVS